MSDLITIVGSVVKSDPELRYTNNGTAVCEFGVRVPGSRKNGTEATFHNVVVWRELAENVADSLQVGDRVVVQGPQKTEDFVGRDGTPKTSTKITGYSVGVDLNYATATVTRLERKNDTREPKPEYADF